MIKCIIIAILITSRYVIIRASYVSCYSFSFKKSLNPIHSTSALQNAHFDLSFLLKDKGSQCIDNLLTTEEKEKISVLVNNRSRARAVGDYEAADLFRDEIYQLSSSESSFLPKGYKIVVKDIPLKDGGGATWSLVPINRLIVDCLGIENKDPYGKQSVLELAHSALGLATSSSEKGLTIDQKKLSDMVDRAKIRLRITGEQDLRGRKASDAAFWFALAGVTDDSSDECPNELKFSLFDALTFICIQELDRFGRRPSCRPNDILHMVERIAAAGVQNDIFISLQMKAAECLESKDPKEIRFLEESGVLDTLRKGKFELHSDRSLLWIWRFSTRQRKQRSFVSSAKKHFEVQNNFFGESMKKENHTIHSGEIDWHKLFDNPTRPIVLDLGCGMGVSVLGLASLCPDEYHDPDESKYFDFQDVNFIGADLSGLAVNYATSISKRWKITKGKTLFFMKSAEEVIHLLKSYPGGISLCMIQFPTPFKFQDKSIEEASNSYDEKLVSVAQRGNMQLPSDAFDGFMVTKQLLSSIQLLLNDDGYILLQSNVEDVAVYMKDLAVDVGFEAVKFSKYVEHTNLSGDAPKRTQKLHYLGMERAIGHIWSSIPILPKRAATETEVACLLNNTPIHRCLMKK